MGQIPPQPTIILPESQKRKFYRAEKKANEYREKVDKIAAKYYERYDKVLKMTDAECEKIAKGEQTQFSVETIKKDLAYPTLEPKMRTVGGDWAMYFPEWDVNKPMNEAYDYEEQVYAAIKAKALETLEEVKRKIKEAHDKAKQAKNEGVAEEKKGEPKKEEPKPMTPEDRKKEALARVDEHVAKNGSISGIFFLSVGRDYLDDKEIVCAIIQRYPQAIAKLPKKFLASNLEEITQSYISGVIDICSDLPNNRSRFSGGAVRYGRDGSTLPYYNEKNDIETILSDAKYCYRDTMIEMSKAATDIKDKDLMIYGSKSRFHGMDPKALEIYDKKVETGFPGKIQSYEEQAKASAEVIQSVERDV